ncbi:MAG: pyrroline-5-carboxylate reductase, partial [Halobacteria archaeon]|nr:pyrroline-5-carboxylate reductase [Halobacteria archaeon]
GTAVIEGLLGSDEEYEVVACDKNSEAVGYFDDIEDVATTTRPSEAAEDVGVVVLAVKPSDAREAVTGMGLSEDQTLVSFAAAVPVESLEEWTEADVVRVMPNLAVEHGEMAAGVSPADDVDEDVDSLLTDLGRYVEIDEEKMDISTAVNGSGPAFVFYLMRAMKRAGVEKGLDDDVAENLAAQTFKGAAEIAEKDARSLQELIDAVCSPGGTTIEGMKVLRNSSVK